jgi:hypothetical protein
MGSDHFCMGQERTASEHFHISRNGMMDVYGRHCASMDISELLSNVLKDRILKGDIIDKPLIEPIDPTFYYKVVRESGEDAFKYFLIDLNKELEFQRKCGCLNLFTHTHEEAKKLVEDLQSDVRVQK